MTSYASVSELHSEHDFLRADDPVRRVNADSCADDVPCHIVKTWAAFPCRVVCFLSDAGDESQPNGRHVV